MKLIVIDDHSTSENFAMNKSSFFLIDIIVGWNASFVAKSDCNSNTVIIAEIVNRKMFYHGTICVW